MANEPGRNIHDSENREAALAPCALLPCAYRLEPDCKAVLVPCALSLSAKQPLHPICHVIYATVGSILFSEPVEEIAYDDLSTFNGRLIIISAYNDLSL
jgi:hypothetical protein